MKEVLGVGGEGGQDQSLMFALQHRVVSSYNHTASSVSKLQNHHEEPVTNTPKIFEVILVRRMITSHIQAFADTVSLFCLQIMWSVAGSSGSLRERHQTAS